MGHPNPKLAEINRSVEHRKAVSEASKGQHYSPRTEFKKGTIPFFKGKHIPTDITRKIQKTSKGKHYSPSTEFKKGQPPTRGMTGKIGPNRGRHWTEEVKEKIRQSEKGRHLHPETEIKEGQRISPRTELTSERVKAWWEDPDYRAKVIAGRLKNRRPTMPEKKLIEIIERHNLPFKYTGDGSFILEGLNPDFVEVNGRKIAIDVFGDYWHTLKADRESYNEEGRKRIFAEYGWKLIVIWESELKSLPEEAIIGRIKNA